MTWLSAAPLLLIVTAWAVLPGAVVTHGLGLRGVAAWGSAPAVSIAVLATSAVAAGWVGVGWGPLPAVVGTVALAVTLGAGRLGAGRLGAGRLAAGRLGVRSVVGRRAAPARDGWAVTLGAVAGLTAAAGLGVRSAVAGMGRPDALSQTYDAVFHYNAVARILATGDASSLTLGLLTDPSLRVSFYPAAWHDLVALTATTVAGTSIPAASNAAAIAVASVVWPLGCLLLVRQVVGPSPVAVFVTPVLATGFVAFPWSLMQFGVLWPNLLGLALLPAGLAALVALLGLGEHGLRPAQAVLIGGLAAVAMALAHPSALFSLAVLAAAPVLWAVFRRTLPLPARLALASAAVGVAALVVYVVLFSAALAEMRTFDWPAYQTPPQALGEVLLGATNRRPAAWALSAAVVGGLVAALRRARTSWLVGSYASAAVMFMMASALETPPAAAATAVWYNDSFRLAAMVPIVAVPLGVIAVQAAGNALADRLRGTAATGTAATGTAATGTAATGTAATGRTAVPTIAALIVLVALLLASSGLYTREHAETLAVTYAPPPDATLLDAAQRDFLTETAIELPPDAVVAQNPWNGSALLAALAGRAVLFPHMQGRWTPEHRLVATRLDEVATAPEVCAAVRRLGVTHVLVGGTPFWPWDARVHDYPGIDGVEGAAPPLIGAGPARGFTLVAAGARYRLYRITECASGADAQSAQPTSAGTAEGVPGQ
jgi:hypothetical protein